MWQRWRIPILLAPALFVIVVLFGGGVIYALLQSLGWQPRIDQRTLSLDAYHNILFGERYARQFWTGLGFTLWVSLASTVISAVLAVGLALAINSLRWGRRVGVFLFQFNLPIPHIVAALGMLFLLSQSGLLARIGASLGLIESPAGFPVLVRDNSGIGIITAYVWKEVPFIGVIVLAVLQSLGEDYQQAARNLGAGTWQRFRYVTLPLIAPALLSASLIVFAFTFGTYEVAEILGTRFPQTLPVLTLRFFTDADLSARAEAMALSMIITTVTTLVVLAYMLLRNRETP